MQGKKTILTDEQLRIIELLASKFCTKKEIASFLGIHPDTITNNFQELFEKGREEGKRNLREWQLESARKGNVTMQIWLGKQYLDQRETQIEVKNNEQRTIIFTTGNETNTITV